MPLFAEINDAVWLGIIGVATLLVKEFFDYLKTRGLRDELRAAKAAVVQQVTTTGAETKAEATDAKDEAKAARRLASTAAEVSISTDLKADRIEKQTNGHLEVKDRAIEVKDKAIADLTAQLAAALLLIPPGAGTVEKIAEKLGGARGS